MRFTNKMAGVAVAVLASATAAGAQVTVAGTTQGCFGMGCTNFADVASSAVGGSGTSLVFDGTAFSGTTNRVTNAFTVGDFGSLVLTGLSGSTPDTQFSTPFSLLFRLTSPAGANSPVTSSIVSGFVGNTDGMGARDISYTGGTTAFRFNTGAGTIAIDGGNIGVMPTNIAGRVTAVNAAVVPEPSTYALMGSGLAGLLGMAARRRRAA